MSIGDTLTEGNKGKNFPFQHKLLQAQGLVISALAPLTDVATESTLISVLNAIVASDQDIEILLVRDTGNSNVVVQQITNYETGVPVVTYKDVNGTAYVPVGPLVYLDPSAVLNLILTELLTLNTTDFATETTLAAILADTALLTAVDYATETTLAAIDLKLTGVGRTTTFTDVLGVASASTTAGITAVSFFNNGPTDATVAGGILKPGKGIDISSTHPNDTLNAIAYTTIATGDLDIIELS